MKVISTSNAPAAVGPYVQAMESDGIVYCSGQIPLDPGTGQLVSGDMGAQATRALANLSAILGSAGCEFSDVIRTTVFLTDLEEFAAFNEVYAAQFGTHRPARSTVAMTALPRGAHLEIGCVARKRT